MDKLQLRLATIIVEGLTLEVAPTDIDLDAPLFGEGLGLDSIDGLEIALLLLKEWGIQIAAEDKENHARFTSLRTLADFVRTSVPSVEAAQ